MQNPNMRVLEVMSSLAAGERGNDRYPHTGPLWDRMIYPGQGYPENPGQDRPGMSPFGRLAKNQPLGKKSVLIYDSSVDGDQQAPCTILRIEGDNLDATQMIVTVAPPLVIPLDLDSAIFNSQNQTGEVGNGQVSGADFTDTGAPIAWPPIEVEIEWGVGGSSAKMTVDATNGCAVAITGSYVNVRAAVTQTTELSGSSALYVISANIGPGLSQGSAPKLTVFTGEVTANTESDVFTVPNFARRAYIVGCDDGTPGSPPAVTVAYLRFWQSPDGNAGATNVGNFFVSANQPQPFTVPNAGMYFSVFNQSITMRYAVVFELNPS